MPLRHDTDQHPATKHHLHYYSLDDPQVNMGPRRGETIFPPHIGKLIREPLLSGGRFSCSGRCCCCCVMYELYRQSCQIVKTSLISLVSNKFREPKGTVWNSVCLPLLGNTEGFSVPCGYLSCGICPFFLAWRTEKGCPIKFTPVFSSPSVREWMWRGKVRQNKVSITHLVPSSSGTRGWVCCINALKTTEPGWHSL